MTLAITAILSILFAFLLAAVLIPTIIFLSEKYSVYDRVDDRKIHTTDVSRLGGVAVFTAFIITASVAVYPYIPLSISVPYLSLSLFLMFFMGLYDDVYGMRSRYKLLIQIAAAMLAVTAGVRVPFSSFHSIFMDYSLIIDSILTVVWIIAFVNAINLIDGMDGLSSGVILIGLMFFAAIGIQENNGLILLGSVILAGAVLPFFIKNYPPAKIFLGDAGAYSIGLIVSIIIPLAMTGSPDSKVIFAPAVIFLFPFLDVAQVIRKRLLLKTSILSPDNNHIHHRMLSMGYRNKEALNVIYMKCVIFGSLGVMFWQMGGMGNLYLYIMVGALVSILYYILSNQEKRMRKVLNILNPDSQWWLQPIRYFSDVCSVELLKVNGKPANYPAELCDISTSGIFLSTKCDTVPGDELKAAIKFSNGKKINVKCRVIWHRVVANGHAAGFGCKFIRPSRAVKRAITYSLRSVDAKIKRRIKPVRPEVSPEVSVYTDKSRIIRDSGHNLTVNSFKPTKQ